VSETSIENNDTSAKLSFQQKVQAWWKGYDPVEYAQYLKSKHEEHREELEAMELSQPLPEKSLPESEQSSDYLDFLDDSAQGEEIWSLERIETGQLIWGSGYHEPNCLSAMTEAIDMLALNDKQHILHLGCGLGEFDRNLATDIGLKITSLDLCKSLVDSHLAATMMEGLDSQITIKQWNSDSDNALPGNFDHAIVEGYLYSQDNKIHILEQLHSSLTANGMVLALGPCVRDKTVIGDQDYVAWAHERGDFPQLISCEDLETLFTDTGFKVNYHRNISNFYKTLIHTAWLGIKDVMHQIKEDPQKAPFLPMIISAGEFWARTTRMLDDGKLSMQLYVLSRTDRTD